MSGVPEAGRRGEAAARQHYLNDGYELICQNYRCRYGEIDLILQRDGVLVFAEVKARAPGALYSGREAVDDRKQHKIVLAAQDYLVRRQLSEPLMRFDVVEVVFGPGGADGDYPDGECIYIVTDRGVCKKMEYTSTRDSRLRVSSAQAIRMGLAPDGGLFVPTSLPTLDMRELIGMSYPEAAFAILKLFLTDYDEGTLRQALDASYGDTFMDKAGYLADLDQNLHVLELWHGPTAAFKDYALQLMPKLLAEAKRMLGDAGETVILVATSGDTGGAALQGYGGVDGIKIAVFYPDHGTSELQRLQMVTQADDNVAVYAVRGNFDDTQRGVKTAFVDQGLAEKLAAQHRALSSANSINWGRLAPQIVYYVFSYLRLCKKHHIRFGEPVDFCVPTGNFGDIMAGWYAKQMGLPVGKLICASNKNNVLAEFLETGRYNAQRDFYKTSSPSMDILVSSNLERLLWHTAGDDAAVKGWMADLARDGAYQVPGEVLDRIREDFADGWAEEADVQREIKQVYDENGYLIDPHTAVAFHVWRKQAQQGGGGRPVIILSTASPFKFPGDVLAALGQPVPAAEFDALHSLEVFAGAHAPQSLLALSGKKVRFTEVIDTDAIVDVVGKL